MVPLIEDMGGWSSPKTRAPLLAAWAIQGPYFSLAYFAKGVEVALIGLIVVDVFRVYGSPLAMVRSAVDSIASLFGGRTGMSASA